MKIFRKVGKKKRGHTTVTIYQSASGIKLYLEQSYTDYDGKRHFWTTWRGQQGSTVSLKSWLVYLGLSRR